MLDFIIPLFLKVKQNMKTSNAFAPFLLSVFFAPLLLGVFLLYNSLKCVFALLFLKVEKRV